MLNNEGSKVLESLEKYLFLCFVVISKQGLGFSLEWNHHRVQYSGCLCTSFRVVTSVSDVLSSQFDL